MAPVIVQAAHFAECVDELVQQVAKRTHLARPTDEKTEATRKVVNQIEEELGRMAGAM